MTRAYSVDLRERMVAAVGDGQSCRQVSALFRVSVSSVVKWAQLARSTGSPAPRPMGCRRGCKLDGERDWLLGRLAEKPDLSLHALLSELRDRGVTVSCDTLWRFLRAAGISFKKRPCSPASRIGLTLPGGGPGGGNTRAGSIPGGWSSSTRPGPRPTWPEPTAGTGAAHR